MPYIKAERRGLDPETAGELNYLFTEAILNYVKKRGVSYQTFNDCLGALEGCKLELYRRSISLYEDGKIKEHGDVY